MHGDLMYIVRKENKREISWENRRSEWMYMMFFGLRMMLEGAGMRNCRWRQSLQLCTLRGNSSRLKGVDGIRGVWLKSTWEDNGRSHYCSLEKEEIWLLVKWLGNEFPHEERGSKPEQKWLQGHMCVCLCMFLFIFLFIFSLEVDITIQRGLVAVVFFATNLRISHLIIRSWMSLC